MLDYAELINRLRRSCAILVDGGKCEDCAGSRCMEIDAADAIEELLAELTTIRKQFPHWISVKEALPAVNERVLVCVDYGDERDVWDSCRWNGKEWEHEVEEIYDYWTSVDFPVTHWMETPPLPAPPKGVE